jgi:hypothetical protein
MTFSPAPYETGNPVNVQRWADETGAWSINVERVAFGYRVQLHHNLPMFGCPDVVLDYCAGAHTEWVEALVTVLRESLRPIPASWSTGQVYQAYPRYKVRPMLKDEACWRELCRLAQVDHTLPVDEIADVDFDRTRATLVQLYLQQVHAGINRDYAQQTLNTLSSFIPAV